MITTLSLILSFIFGALGFIHFYWLFGGKWGLKHVVPTKAGEESFSAPPKFATFLVAIILILFALIYLLKSGCITINTPTWVENYCYWVIPSIFILRAIGDFNYVGFFKKIKNTHFANADTKWFSPLCIIIGIIGFLLLLL